MGNVGALGAAAPLAVFVGMTGWREAFYYLGGITIVLAALTYTFVRNKPQDMGLPSLNEVDGIKVAAEVQAADDAIGFKEALKMSVTNWNFRWLAVYAFAVYGPHDGISGIMGGSIHDGYSGLYQAGSPRMWFPGGPSG